MSAFLKVYTDSGHSNEVSHTTNINTTLNGAVSSGASSIIVHSTTGMPAQGVLDIIDGSNNETLAYSSIAGTTIYLMTALGHNHADATTVNQWIYVLAVGDQTNGILNDGSESTPQSGNTGTWYAYNAGDQSAQSPTISTSNASPSTTSGYNDTVVSITSSTTGFSTSVSPSNIASGAQVQFWVCAQVPSGQSVVGNPQECVINIAYSTV
jgi:hypothetical protein